MKLPHSTLVVGLIALFLSACSTQRGIDESKVIDLTHSFDQDTIYWPNAQRFRWEKESWGQSPGGYWYSAARYSASEHGGTHLDSPIHFGEGKATVDAIPLEKLIGPAVVIDISAACASNTDYLLKPEDIANWEREHGQIQPSSIVLVRTGWDKYWPDAKRYLGSAVPGDTTNLHFPGLSREAAEVLRDRKVDAVGIDTASIDYGASRDFIVHQILNGAGVYGLENVAHVDQVPATGATLIALPMKIKGGTGAPARIIAVLP